MTIYEIKELTKETAPYFFNKDTLKFFGQTLANFTVAKQQDNRFLISADIKDGNNKKMGMTTRYFNPINNKLERG